MLNKKYKEQLYNAKLTANRISIKIICLAFDEFTFFAKTNLRSRKYETALATINATTQLTVVETPRKVLNSCFIANSIKRETTLINE